MNHSETDIESLYKLMLKGRFTFNNFCICIYDMKPILIRKLIDSEARQEENNDNWKIEDLHIIDTMSEYPQDDCQLLYLYFGKNYKVNTTEC
jgi:hypothetical protein